MSKGAQKKLNSTKSIKHPNMYIRQMYKEYASLVFDEAVALKWKGLWLKKVFHKTESDRLHLEIGTGAGFHIAYKSFQNPQDSFIGIELKYKPLIQSIKRVCRQQSLSAENDKHRVFSWRKKQSSVNVRMVRYNACLVSDLFASQELDNIYIHFPDPWPKKRHIKHRLFSPAFIENISQIQRRSGFVELKTDCKDYFLQACALFGESPQYLKTCYSLDLHSSNFADQPLAGFESLFVQQNLPIYYAQFQKQ